MTKSTQVGNGALFMKGEPKVVHSSPFGIKADKVVKKPQRRPEQKKDLMITKPVRGVRR